MTKTDCNGDKESDFRLRENIKWLMFPGLNLHARLRFRSLPKYFGSAKNGRERLVLDAGCGNGMLSYQSYLRGNRVIGVSIKEGEVARNRKLFNEFHGIPEDRLQFRVHNLYDVASLGMQFDEIICTEVLEHIERDEDVCRSFFEILKPGGVLHLCCPNADHVYNQEDEIDEHEGGGHVRSGYTWQSYQSLLDPLGFELSEPIGLGGPIRQGCNNLILAAQKYGRLALGIPMFLAVAPLTALDVFAPKSITPFCLYVRARKPVGDDATPARRDASSVAAV